jgi:hypothetical protein
MTEETSAVVTVICHFLHTFGISGYPEFFITFTPVQELFK